MQPKARRTQPSFTALVLPFHKCWQKLGIAGMLKNLEAQLSQAHIRMMPLKHVYSNPFPTPVHQGEKYPSLKLGGWRTQEVGGLNPFKAVVPHALYCNIRRAIFSSFGTHLTVLV